ncbi:MAG: hypothetical protein AAGM22_24190 [Acidobacteriota bacterium]
MYGLFYRFSLFVIIASCCAVAVARAEPITPLAGEWNRLSPGDEIGYYNPNARAFVLCKERFAFDELSCVEFPVPDLATGIPLMGRWAANESVDRPALFDPTTGTLHLYSYGGCLPLNCVGSGSLVAQRAHALRITNAESAVVGDWDGSGADSVALISPFDTTGQGSRAQAYLFVDGFGSFQSSALWGLDLSGLTPIAGDWPGTAHTGDSLGFYDRVHHDVLLLDGLGSGSLLNLPLVTQGLQIFDFVVDGTGVGGFGTYFPHNCSSFACHRVELWRFPSGGNNWPSRVINEGYPEMDSRFPDDPGDP